MGKKRFWGKGLPLTLAVIFLTLGNTAVSYAEEPIKSVMVLVTSSVEAGTGSVSAEVENSKYYMESCAFSGSGDRFEVGDTPKAVIVLAAEEGYYFDRIGSRDAVIEGAEFNTATRSSDRKTLKLLVELQTVGGTLGNIEEAYWETAPLGRAKWSKADDSAAYELKLYRNENLVHHVERTRSVSYNFFPYMTVQGNYSFKVRTVAKSDGAADYLEPGQWTESDYCEITIKDAKDARDRGNTGSSGAGSTTGAMNVTGPGANPGSQLSVAGWISEGGGWWYKNADGSFTRNNWQLINGKWYLFGMNGYMLTGWQRYNGKEYYLTSNGDMVSGWFQDNRVWYYLNPDMGKLSGGWFLLDNSWYYLNPDGSMATGFINYKGDRYYLDPETGRMLTDTRVGEYYLNADGVWVP